MNIKEIDSTIFINNIPLKWKETFNKEFKTFGLPFKLYSFLENNEIIGGFCLGYNPDYFINRSNQLIIDKLNKEKYNKISYYYIIDKYRGQKKGAKMLLNFIKNNGGKYFLTCNGEKLKKYYLSLGFKVIGEEQNKFILVLI